MHLLSMASLSRKSKAVRVVFSRNPSLMAANPGPAMSLTFKIKLVREVLAFSVCPMHVANSSFKQLWDRFRVFNIAWGPFKASTSLQAERVVKSLLDTAREWSLHSDHCSSRFSTLESRFMVLSPMPLSLKSKLRTVEFVKSPSKSTRAPSSARSLPDKFSCVKIVLVSNASRIAPALSDEISLPDKLIEVMVEFLPVALKIEIAPTSPICLELKSSCLSCLRMAGAFASKSLTAFLTWVDIE
mmetsp:Transcript_44430/g.74837  ORF Transcript_44430/g.74837 Transcript_44430/m.74837 type:complete len:243 (-) Transcript_44430:16-744(-)